MPRRSLRSTTPDSTSGNSEDLETRHSVNRRRPPTTEPTAGPSGANQEDQVTNGVILGDGVDILYSPTRDEAQLDQETANNNATFLQDFHETLRCEEVTKHIKLNVIGGSSLVSQLLGEPRNPTEDTGFKTRLITETARYHGNGIVPPRDRNLETGVARCRQRLRNLLERKRQERSRTEPNINSIENQDITDEEKVAFVKIMNAEPLDENLKYVTIQKLCGDELINNASHCIMTPNSIYLLTVDVSAWGTRNTVAQGKVIDDLASWMRTIAAFDRSKDETEAKASPIVLVASHMDRGMQITEEVVINKILNELDEIPRMQKLVERHLKGYVYFSDLQTDRTTRDKIVQLWQIIDGLAHLQSGWEEKIPGAWIFLKQKIMQIKERRKIMTVQHVIDINDKHTLKLETEEIVKFLRYIEDSESVFCTEPVTVSGELNMGAYLILDLNWVLQCFVCLVRNRRFVNSTENLRWRNYRTTCRLTIDILKLVWKTMTTETLKALLSALHHLDLIIPVGQDVTEAGGGPEETSYRVPALLANPNPDLLRQRLDGEQTATLCFEIENQFIPSTVRDKIIAGLVDSFVLPLQDGGLVIQRTFVSLKYDAVWNFVAYCAETTIKVTMFNNQNYKPQTGIGSCLRGELKKIIDKAFPKTKPPTVVYSLHNDYRAFDNKKERRAYTENFKEYEHINVSDVDGVDDELNVKDCAVWFGGKPSGVSGVNMDVKRKTRHAKMFMGLEGFISPNSPNTWSKFQIGVRSYLSEEDVYGEHVKNVYTICKRLMDKGVIRYGQYGVLRDIVSGINAEAAEVIDKATLEMSGLTEPAVDNRWFFQRWWNGSW